MMEIKLRGEGKAELIRNKRRGLKLKLKTQIKPPHTGSYCKYCSLDFRGCPSLCWNFTKATGIKKFWFERDEN